MHLCSWVIIVCSFLVRSLPLLCMYIRLLELVPYLTDILFCCFSLCVSYYIPSVARSSNFLIFCSVISNLLLIPFSVFFISNIFFIFSNVFGPYNPYLCIKCSIFIIFFKKYSYNNYFDVLVYLFWYPYCVILGDLFLWLVSLHCGSYFPASLHAW